MSESDFYTVNHRYEAQGAPGEWPTWELRAHGSAAPALAPDPAAPDDPPGGLGPGGPLPRADPLGPWCSARLTFADGARVDVVVTVSDDRITVEDVRADPPLPLSGLTDLAGWIEGPLDDAFRAATGRPRRTRPTPRRPGPATAPERPAPALGETPAEAAGTVRGDGTLHGAHPGAGTGRDGADRGGVEPSAEPAAGRVAEPTAEASGAPTTESTGAPNGAPGIERTAEPAAEPTGAPATEVPAAPSVPLAAPGPSAASAPAAASPVTVPVSVAPVSSEPPVPSEASTSAAVITPSETAASSEAAMPSETAVSSEAAMPSEAATASEAAASSDTSMSSAAPAPSGAATPAGASASAPLPERARSSVLARSRAGERRRVAADAYRQAQREGRDPVLAVMHATGRNRRRSLRLIAGARDEGLLTPRHNKR
ncbi:DUF6214 family protein [Streptomyces angustmyceticus]|uniref:DUF6214 family protein n=1 Tax=Streptomyces angustmyceticus TaxID=285578 RepID=UPI003825F2E7